MIPELDILQDQSQEQEDKLNSPMFSTVNGAPSDDPGNNVVGSFKVNRPGEGEFRVIFTPVVPNAVSTIYHMRVIVR